ncbi:MAG TPA: tRNA pseudouridine(13) synthase TruD [Woeseiaceae bacterium]|nr:tRNA pseudouridine(13) synthase TruD [Woeseiaceae bacterium]
MSLPDWARAHGSPLFAATIRSSPADFDVTEELGYDFDGAGEHDFLYLEKTGTNTEWLARQLAKFAGVAAKDVGYSGLKDRDAITRQWFSVPRWHSADWASLDVDGVTVLDVQRHSKKLRRGAHKANHFRIVLRGPEVGSVPIDERLASISEQGVPNYFGPQRFGREGANLSLADTWARGKRLPRHKRSIAISSARSFLFNEVLHQRVLDGSWNRLLHGDIANLDGTGSVFSIAEPDQELELRCRELDIHPAAQLPGEGSDCRNERWQKAFDKARVKPGSRSLRLRVRDLQAHDANDGIMLSFALGRGAFATSVLREIATISTKP